MHGQWLSKFGLLARGMMMMMLTGCVLDIVNCVREVRKREDEMKMSAVTVGANSLGRR